MEDLSRVRDLTKEDDLGEVTYYSRHLKARNLDVAQTLPQQQIIANRLPISTKISSKVTKKKHQNLRASGESLPPWPNEARYSSTKNVHADKIALHSPPTLPPSLKVNRMPYTSFIMQQQESRSSLDRSQRGGTN